MDADGAATRSSPLPAAAAARPRHRNRRYANFFVGFRITNPVIVANVTRLQQRIAAQFPALEVCSVDPRTLHVTLCTLNLHTEEHIQQAVRILAEHAYKNGAPVFGDDTPSFDFRGVGFFGDHYLFYSPLDTTSRFASILGELAETLHKAFDAMELTTGPFRKPYEPHITLWKTTRHIKHMKQLNMGREVPIERELGSYLLQLEPEHFGTETPTVIELLSAEEKEADGYYKAYQSASLVVTDEGGQ